MPHALYHYYVTTEGKDAYQFFNINFASPCIEQRVLEFTRQLALCQVVDYLNAAECSAFYGIVRGRIFEAIAHNIISGGGTFPFAKLLPDGRRGEGSVSVTLPCLTLREVSGFETIDTGDSLSYWKMPANHAAFDSYFTATVNHKPMRFGAQITINSEHAMNAKGLEAARNFWGQELAMLRVVPIKLFSRFKWQPVKAAQRAGTRGPKKGANGSSLEQYIVGLELNVCASCLLFSHCFHGLVASSFALLPLPSSPSQALARSPVAGMGTAPAPVPVSVPVQVPAPPTAPTMTSQEGKEDEDGGGRSSEGEDMRGNKEPRRSGASWRKIPAGEGQVEEGEVEDVTEGKEDGGADEAEDDDDDDDDDEDDEDEDSRSRRQ